MPLPSVNHAAPSTAGLTPEVVTVSALLSMPAVWTALVERALPAGVLLERFLIVLLTCALLAELVRRLGEGGALGAVPTLADGASAAAPASSRATTMRAAGYGTSTADDDFGNGFAEYDAPSAAESPLALDAPFGGDPETPGGFDSGLNTGLNAGLDAGLADFGSLDDLGDLAPLDLDADPFADPV